MKKFLGVLLALFVAIAAFVPAASAATTTPLLSKTGVLSVPEASSAEQVVGFNYIVLGRDDSCMTYYAANPPLIGMSKPVEIPCPLGIVVIDNYNIDYKQAIALFEKTNCGGAFTGISLSQPLVPGIINPFWTIDSVTGQAFSVNADTGQSTCKS